MAYSSFTLGEITRTFGLTIQERNVLFADVPAVALRDTFRALLDETLPLALAVSTEKARSELIITPILLELWRMTGQRIGFFSGVEFAVDEARGLSGFCDYILTRSPHQLFVESPVFMLVEAKNEDMKRGYAQCIAEMLAAQTFNAREGTPIETVYGAVTIGDRWKFLTLQNAYVQIDAADYYITDIGKIMGILLHVAAPEMNGVTPAGAPQ